MHSHTNIADPINPKVVGSSVQFISRRLISPLVLSAGVIENVVEARVQVTVSVQGKLATGWGSIYLSEIWAWPDPLIPHNVRRQAMMELCTRIAANIAANVGAEPAHPVELGLRLAQSVREHELVPDIPELARVLCASPFDAAIHDATGRALNRSAFTFFEGSQPIPTADPWFPLIGASRAIRSILRTTPIREFSSWYIMGPRDELNDGLASRIRSRGDRCFKLKIIGHDWIQDASWTVAVFDWLTSIQNSSIRFIVDANESFRDANSVAEYVNLIRSTRPAAYSSLSYLEQPTSRNLRNKIDWRTAQISIPILADESFVGLETLPVLKGQQWSGVGLKTCKGHSLCLVAAAWAKQNGLLVSMQDLTNPGFALVQAALFAAFVPTINGVELNSPQFTPDANQEWLPRLKRLMVPADGTHYLPGEIPIGLGSSFVC